MINDPRDNITQQPKCICINMSFLRRVYIQRENNIDRYSLSINISIMLKWHEEKMVYVCTSLYDSEFSIAAMAD